MDSPFGGNEMWPMWPRCKMQAGVSAKWGFSHTIGVYHMHDGIMASVGRGFSHTIGVDHMHDGIMASVGKGV